MWAVQGVSLQMAEGDYGIQLPVTISGTTLAASDVLKFVFFNRKKRTGYPRERVHKYFREYCHSRVDQGRICAVYA